jgi:hypothetical protein
VKAKMRDELMKKFAEDDRLEQVSEHKRRMKAPRDDGATGGASESNEKMGSSLGKKGTIWGFTGKSETCDGFSKLDDQLISWFLDGGTVCETMSVSISVA